MFVVRLFKNYGNTQIFGFTDKKNLQKHIFSLFNRNSPPPYYKRRSQTKKKSITCVHGHTTNAHVKNPCHRKFPLIRISLTNHRS